MRRLSLFLVSILCLTLFFPTTGLGGKNDDYYQKIKLGAEWFLHNQNETFLHYEYLPFEQKHNEGQHRLRELASLWGIARAANFFKEDDLKDLAIKGWGFFEPHLKEDKENDFYYLNIEPSSIKLAYSAFAILSLLELEHPKKDFYLKELADGILWQQQSDGSFKTFFYSDINTGVDYYPGEALLALMSLHEHDADPRYLAAAQKAFPYYRDYWRGNKNTAFVPWQMQANFKLWQATKDEEVADFIWEMGDYIMSLHNRTKDCRKITFTRGIVTAVFMEGMNKGYELAKQKAERKRMVCYRAFIQKSADHVLRLQMRADNNFDVEALPEEAVGGFLGSRKGDRLRVDNNQHAIMALMESYRLKLIPPKK